MADNIYTIGGGKGKEDQQDLGFLVRVFKTDGEVEEVKCEFFGTSPELPGFLVFYSKLTMDIETPPNLLISVHDIRRVEVEEGVVVEDTN